MLSEQVRNESYKNLVNDLGHMQKQVLECLEKQDATDIEISIDTGLSLSCVNGRRNELVDMNLVCARGKSFNENTKQFNTIWGVVLFGEQTTQEKVNKCLPYSFIQRLEKMIYKLKQEGNSKQIDNIRGLLE